MTPHYRLTLTPTGAVIEAVCAHGHAVALAESSADRVAGSVEDRREGARDLLTRYYRGRPTWCAVCDPVAEAVRVTRPRTRWGELAAPGRRVAHLY